MLGLVFVLAACNGTSRAATTEPPIRVTVPIPVVTRPDGSSATTVPATSTATTVPATSAATTAPVPETADATATTDVVAVAGLPSASALGDWTPSCSDVEADALAAQDNIAHRPEFSDTRFELWEFPEFASSAFEGIAPLRECAPGFLLRIANAIERTWADATAGEVVAGLIRSAVDASGTCTPERLRTDLDTSVDVVDHLCLDGWAYLDSPDGLLVGRIVDEVWTAYVAFPTRMCRSEAVDDGVPLVIVDRIAWTCSNDNEEPVMAWDGEYRPAPSGTRDIHLGHTGNTVRELQRKLRNAGYAVEVDGLYGPTTEEVVRKFQRDHDLIVDGRANPEVWTALDAEG